MRYRAVAMLANLSLVLGSLLICFIVLEVVFRALDQRGVHTPRVRSWEHALVPKEDLLPGVQLQFKPHAQFEMRYDSNPHGAFDENNTIHYSTNNFGFRGPDFQMERPEGTQRILLLGDSFTFGEGVRWEDTFCPRLEALLNERSATRTEVLGMAAGAWNTTDEINYLEQMGIRFKPDLVVVVFVPNDAEYAGGLDLWENFWTRHELPALRWSYFASWAYSTVQRQVDGRRYTTALVQYALGFSPEWENCRKHLVKGKDICNGISARYCVVLFPFMYELNDSHPFLPIHQMITDHCRSNGIEVFDLFAAFKGRPYLKLWVHPTDQHPNEKGHQIAAEAMAKFIEKEGLLR